MSKEIKIIHFAIVDGTQEQIKTLSLALNTFKKGLPFDVEFIVTDNRVELHSVKYLIDELIKLYKQNKPKNLKKKGEKDGNEKSK